MDTRAEEVEIATRRWILTYRHANSRNRLETRFRTETAARCFIQLCSHECSDFKLTDAEKGETVCQP